MQNASNTNRKERAQKAARREKFNANHSDKTLLNDVYTSKLYFSHLKPEQIAKEKNKIEKQRILKDKKNIVTAIISLAITTALLFSLYYLFVR